MDESHTIDVGRWLHRLHYRPTPPKKGKHMLETLVQQIKEFGKKTGSYIFEKASYKSEQYIMDETTMAYILYDSIGNIKEVKFYR